MEGVTIRSCMVRFSVGLILVCVTELGAAPAATGLSIEITESGHGQTSLGVPGACFKYRLRNVGQQTYHFVQIRVYFLDTQGRRFFESVYTIVESNGDTTGDPPARPNYSKVGGYCTTAADGLELERWQDGRVEVEIAEASTEPDRAVRAIERVRNRRRNVP